MFIIGVTASLTLIAAAPLQVLPAILIGTLAVALIAQPGLGLIDRWRGGLLIGIYVVFVLVSLQLGG